MTSPSVFIERRAGQRFPYLIPLSLRHPATSIEGVGFTQDVSSRGVFFLTEAALTEGTEIELTLKMPSEITLGESMRVRARGRILRVTRLPEDSQNGKIGVAVRFEGYEYLAESADSAPAVSRASALHPQAEDELPSTTFQSR